MMNIPLLDQTPFLLGGMRIGMFDEATALDGMERFHETSDGLNLSGKSVRTIPFGCEYEITRTWDAANGILRFAVDARALNNGTMKECMLDGLTVKKDVLSAGLLADDGTCSWSGSASGSVMPRAVELKLADGTFAELSAGDDLWRHRPAAEFGAEAHWELRHENGKLAFERTMFRFPEDAEPPKRPWRWEYLLLWGKPEPEIPAGAEAIDCAGLCFAAPAVRREFRDRVRKAKTSLRLINVAPHLCMEAAHTGRGRELVHQDTGELLALYVWANRTLQNRGLDFTVKLTPEAAAARPALQAVLGRKLESLFQKSMPNGFEK